MDRYGSKEGRINRWTDRSQELEVSPLYHFYRLAVSSSCIDVFRYATARWLGRYTGA